MSSRRRVIEEEEEDEPMENGEVIGSGSVEQEKRGDDDGEKEHSQDEEDGAEDKEGPSPKRQRLEGGAATSKSFVDEDGFREGAIIRIRCRNFVTYDYVELKPGPSLNMIIGPNGTGKSSIVCAMAIALGNNPKVVGRSPDISAYVKEGEEKAWVEIELKRRGKGRNLIIKRSFGRDGNSSTYKLNGEHATEKAVKDKVQALNIKVDNLCSFLPQDRVSDFAKMTKRELLRATEGSIGSAQLTEWHDRLVEMRREEKGILASVQAIKDDVEKLNERTAKMQRDVIRYEERQAFLAEVKEIELKISFQKYSDARAEYIEAKEKRDALKVQFAELKNRLQPLETELNELQAEIKSADAEVKQYNIEQQKQEKDINKAKENITKCESEGDDLCNRLKTIKRREREKQEKLAAMRADIEKLQNSLTALEEELSANGLLDVGHSSQPRGELASIQGEIEEKNRALREIAEKIIDIQQDQRSINEECQEIRRNKDNLAEQLRGLDDVKNQKLENLRRFHPNEYKATLWLRENRHTFKSTIYDPICLEIGPKDMRYASPLETNIPMNRMKTFVTTCKEDYYALQHQLFDVMKLRVNLSKPDNLNLETYVPKIPREEIREMGFDGYLLDYLEGPSEVLAALCEFIGIHNMPIRATEFPSEAQRRLESDSRISNYHAGGMSYLIRRKYGAQSTRAFKWREARLLTQSVDMALKHSLEGQIEVLRVNLGQRAERIKARNLEEGRLRTADGRLREEKGRLMDRKKEIQQQKHKYDRMKQAIDSKQIQYDNLQSQSTSSEEEEARIKQEIRACTVKKAKFALSLAKMQEKLVQIFYGRTLAALRSIKLAADLNAKENELADLNEEREELQADLVKINNHLAVLKTVARELLEAWNKAKGDNKIDEEQAAPIVNQEKYKGMTLDELQELAEEKKTRADLIMSVDPAQIARFEADKKAIITKQADAERGERKATEIAGKIERVKNKWQPQLEELVAKISVSFSKAFDGIGCAGEVKLSPDPDDYDKWGIEIFVKFRDNEKLHALDGQRQSGGERSVSTILYLMSLQSLSNVPFRVVDEINQGMDPRNERMVHREMVRAACKAGTSQYFLITPKLLADLEYHERMKVLNVFNGPFNMPAIDFRGYLNRKRQVANTA